jgi:hypothetical protein
MKKSQNMMVWLKKICFGAASLHNFAMASKRRNNDVHLQKKKSVINMISLLLSVCDWSIIMIGPGCSLLIVAHLFAVPVSVLWV